ncbi:hypothetical protein Bca4012_102176 [Brassica carinata]
MATSVDNRHYPRLSSALNGGVVHSFKPPLVPSPSLGRDQDQSVNVPTEKSVDTTENQTTKEDSYDSSDDEDESHNRYVSYYKEMVLKSNSDLEPSALDSRDESTADNWIHRNSSMVRLTGKHPFNAEAPLPRLMHHGFITPVPLHYVRNHGGVPKAEWSDWSVEVTGLVKRPARLTMEQLITEFPSREFPVTLVCAGNRRKEQNMVKQTIGFNWGSAGVSTSLWRGVALSDVLRRCGVYSKRGGALNVCFEGAEDLPGGGGSKYGTSIKKEMAMDPARDIILAYMQNGELLTPDHGFPVRVIIPGFIGGRMVKWLKRIIVTPQESDNYYHYKDNRVLPSCVDAELANEESWWYRPEYIINELNINSVITTPGHEEILPINAFTTQKPYTLKGYAYSGGGKKVTRVEVTLDGGETWSVCELDHQEKPNKYGKFWCWCFWSLDVEVLDLLSAREVAVRAWDESLNTQPEKLIWNLMGMMNNCWFRIKTNVCKPHRGEIGIVFEHPTRPGNQSGGWMAKERQIEKSSESHPTLKKSVSTPFMNTASKMYSMSEVRKHNSAESAWIIVHGHIYDCTPPIRELAPAKNIALVNPREKVPVKLIEKTSISHDVRRFRFALPSEDQQLGLPVGKHIFLCATINDKLCLRAYTPTSTVDAVGYIDLVIKVYFKNVHPRFPNGGLMSQHLDSLPIGAVLDIKGPLGHIEYQGRGKFMVSGKPKFANKLAMLAGGTGITPIYQVIQSILSDPEDETEMFVVYANRTEDDILAREELEGWADKFPDRLKIWYVVEIAKEGWEYSTGFITEAVLREHVPEGLEGESLALACGPPPMIQFALQPNLEKMGYNIKEDLLIF